MRKPISPRAHGVLDYATSATTAAAAEVLNFPPPARAAARALAGGYTGLAAVTDYPLAARRVVPFKAHGATEAALGLALPFVPWLLGFADHKPARNFFLGLTAVTFVVAALTDWEKRDSPPETR
jgi:hypothetical protein